MPIVLDKPPGWTLLESIDALRRIEPALATARLGYAGRLDPMAEGVLLVLRDDENRNAAQFRALDKTYRVQVLFGVATDSYDALGLVSDVKPAPSLARVQAALPSLVRTFEQTVPAFSSHRVNGKPMFHWARRGLADTIVRPVLTRTVSELVPEHDVLIEPASLCESIAERIACVRGDFRQEAIVSRWRSVLASHTGPLMVTTLRITCSSGTFMRAIAHDLGLALDSAALALSIERLRVGPYERSAAHAIGHARSNAP